MDQSVQLDMQLPPGLAVPPVVPPPQQQQQQHHSARYQRHQRQADWVTCLDCINKPKPSLPDRWRPHREDCVKCLKARSRAISADKAQIDIYVNHSYSRTGELMVLLSYEPTRKELKIQGAPVLVERFLNHDVQGFIRRAVMEPAVSDSEEARMSRACSFKKPLPLLPRKGLHRMTQDELRTFIGPLVCAYADREQPGWSDESKKIDCWPDGIPWGNPKHGSWKLGSEVPNSIFRRVIANIYHAAGREDMLKPSPPVCRGACDKCCGVLHYDEDTLPLDEEEMDPSHMGPHGMEAGAHLAQHGLTVTLPHSIGPHQLVHLTPTHHQLTEGEQAALAVAVAAAAAAAPPLPTVLQSVSVPVTVTIPAAQPGELAEDAQAKRRRLEQDEMFMRWPHQS